MNNLLIIIQLLMVPVLAPLGVGFVNKLKAKLQRRRGASLLQPYRDLYKLMHKDEVIGADTSWITLVAPYICFAVTIVVSASIPLLPMLMPNLGFFGSDLFVVVCLFGLATFWLALGGLDSGGAFGGLGSSRELTLAAMAEIAFVFAILPLVVIHGSTNLMTMASTVNGQGGYYLVTTALAFVGFMIVLLAETKRYPYDNPETHLELTMVHEAMLLEYSGKRLALMEWAAANKLLIMVILAVNLYLPLNFGLSITSGFLLLVLSLIVLLLKVGIVFVFIALLESFMAKFRFFRLPDLLMASFVLSCIALGLVL